MVYNDWVLIKKFHTLQIPLPEELHNKLFHIYQKLATSYESMYLNEKNWYAHVTIGYVSLDDANSEAFVKYCESSFGNTPEFEIRLDSFALGSKNKYIFLNLDKKSNETMLALRKKFEEEVMKKFKYEISQKYLDDWDNLSERQKELLRTTGSSYEYEPHISMVKLEPEKTVEAFKTLNS